MTENKRLKTFTKYCGHECLSRPPPKGQVALLCTLFSYEQAKMVQLDTSRRPVVPCSGVTYTFFMNVSHKTKDRGWVIPGSQALDDITEIATWESKRAVSHWASFLASPGLSLLICNRGDNNSSYVELWKLNELVSKVLGTMPVSRLPEARMWNIPA